MKRAGVYVVLAALLGASGCIYSFTGSSVPPHLKSIAIPLFDDQSGSGEPGLREKLTNAIIDRFRQDNNLEIADRTHADSILEGIIVSLQDQPQVIAAGETVTLRQITLVVKVTYQDMKLRKKVWDKQYSDWGNYPISGGPAQRSAGVDDAVQKLSEDILLDTVSGW